MRQHSGLAAPMRTPTYAAQLREIGNGVYAYLQEGSWGFSNAGLVTASGGALLVDTLYDLTLTARMLDEMRRANDAASRIDTLVNTHANGDPCSSPGMNSRAWHLLVASNASQFESCGDHDAPG